MPRQSQKDRIAELEAALLWYVEHDEILEHGFDRNGEPLEVKNAKWIAGKRRAQKLLGLETTEDEDYARRPPR